MLAYQLIMFSKLDLHASIGVGDKNAEMITFKSGLYRGSANRKRLLFSEPHLVHIMCTISGQVQKLDVARKYDGLKFTLC